MIAHYQYQLALRAKALTLQVATTGSIGLAASTTGYTRSSGSFISDGFMVGMEIQPAGFTLAVNNEPKAITAVTATTITCAGCAAEAEAIGRSLTVGLPALRAWENVTMQPVTGRPYVTEQYLPGPTKRETIGATAQLEVLPMYILTIYAVANTGLAAAAKYADAILTLFAPGTQMTAGNGDLLRVRGDAGPFRAQLYFESPGWALVPVTIPLRVRTTNTI